MTDQTWEYTAEIRESCDTVVTGRKQDHHFLGFWPAATKAGPLVPRIGGPA
ncbi:MAG: hypothetical protein ABW215_09100 [Kibdelosporangium sp.]